MPEHNELEKKIKLLNDRMDIMERQLKEVVLFLKNKNQDDFSVTASGQHDGLTHPAPEPAEDSTLESNVVEYGIAWLSNIVYILGIIFFMEYLFGRGQPGLSGLTGYAATASIFVLSRFLRKSFPHLIPVLTLSGLLLSYYVTLRLHYFSADPLIPDPVTGLLLMIGIALFQAAFSLRKKSEGYGAVTLLSVLATALFSDSTHVMLSLILLASALSFLFFILHGWWRLLIITIVLVYLTHLLWFFNNPLMGHPLQAVASGSYSLIYLSGYALIFSAVNLAAGRRPLPGIRYEAMAVIIACGFLFAVSIEVFSIYENYSPWIFTFISLASLSLSVFLKSRNGKIFIPAFYACFGFMTLSLGIYGFAKFPDSYFLLAFQSLLVVSLALWFRSKTIVVVNTLMFLSILVLYLFGSPSTNVINFMFAVTALSTARILNWKKDRLTLKTDLLRNLYLLEGFFMVLYGLNRAVPGQWVTLSWTLAAVFFLLLSVLLNNIKYRWMSIFTLFFTGIHFLLIDMEKLQTGYRILASLFFAAIALGVSLYYTKRVKKNPGPGLKNP